MENIRRFVVNIKCASCKLVFEKIFANYDDIQWSLNTSAKILKIIADESKYSDQFVIEKLVQFGYKGEKID